MQEQIIYQTAQTNDIDVEKQSILSRICSCFSFIRISKKNPSIKYQLGIDSPKSLSSIIQRKTLVLDLDETLVHSSFQIFQGYDFDIEIFVQGMKFRIYVIVRPGTSQFLEAMNEYYDIILWTASLQQYADPVMDRIDINKRAIRRLFRDSCTLLSSGLTKDLTNLNINLKDVIIIDNSENSFKLQPLNAYKILDFFFDTNDSELFKIQPFLKYIASQNDVRPVFRNFEDFMKITEQFDKMDDFQERSLKETNRIEQSQRLLLRKVESVANRSPDQSRVQQNHVITQNKFPIEPISKSLILGQQKPSFNDQLTSPNINSPHPERAKLNHFKENEQKSTDEVESQEQTCLEEDGDLSDKN